VCLFILCFFKHEIKPKKSSMFCIRPIGLLNIMLSLSLIAFVIFPVKETISFQGHCGVCRVTRSVRMQFVEIFKKWIVLRT